MFLKLLKHEWKASRRIIGALCAVIAISGLLAGGSLRYITWSVFTENQFMVGVYTMIITAAAVAIVGCCLGATYLLAHRFYQSRFTDQGYLTLTLPVTAHQQLLSGLVHILLGVVLVALTACLSAAGAVWIFLGPLEQIDTAELAQILVDGFRKASVETGLTGKIELMKVAQVLISFPADVVVLMLAITVGAQTHKLPVLKGLAVYMGTDIVVTESLALLELLTENTTLTAAVGCVIYAAVGVGAYFVMHRMFERKLNLI